MTTILRDGEQTTIEVPIETHIWELRTAWAKTRTVRLMLSEKCLVPKVIGTIRRIAVTGAFVEIDGWEIPDSEILSVGYPTITEIEEYRAERVGPEAFQR